MEEDIKILDELLESDFDYETEINYNDRQAYKNVKNELERLQQENEELRKGQHSLMQSRKKWKDRYYKEKKSNL